MRIHRIGVVVLAMSYFLLGASIAHAGRDVHGVVTDALGHPREYVYFSVDGSHYDFDHGSDADGKFVLKNVPSRPTYWSTTSKSGKAGLFVVPADATQMEVKLQFGNLNLTGRVVDAQKRGVKDAAINIYLKRGDDEFLIGEHKTDAGGYFEDSGLAGDGLTLIARVMIGDNVIAAFEPVALHDKQISLELPDLTVDKIAGKPGEMETRRAIGGVVNDDLGKPIAGAKVEIHWSLASHFSGYAYAQTGADGHWSRRIPINVPSVDIKLFDDHHVSTIFDRGAPALPMEKLLDGSAVSVMPRGAIVRGIVHDEAGKPVDDALVLAATTGANGGTLETDEDVAVHSAADGTFQIEGIPSGGHELVVYGRNLAPTIVKSNPQPDSPPLQITLKSGDDLHGVVTDTAGKPIPDAEITIYTWIAPDGGWHYAPRNPTADEQGRFTLAHLPPGSFMLRIEKKGYNAIFPQDIRVQAGPQVFKLSKPATMAGKVVDDASGLPIKAFTIVAGYHDDKVGACFPETPVPVKAASGAFSQRLRWTSQTTQPVRIIADGYLVKDTAVDTTDGAPISEIRLTKGAPYAGKILRPGGQPAAGAQIAWVSPGRQAFVEHGTLKGDYVYSADIVASSDHDGGFKLPRSNQKGHIFVTAGAGYALISSDDFHDGQSITLTPWATIHGSIHSSAKSLAGKYVMLRPTDRPRFDESTPVSWQLYATTNVDGTFTVEEVPAMPLRIGRNEVGLVSYEQSIDPKAGETLDVQLGAGGQTIRGKIDAADLPTDSFNAKYSLGKHYTGVYARLADAPLPAPQSADSGYAAELSPDGMFVIDGVPAGKYELLVKLRAPPMPQSCGLSVAMASAKMPFEVKDQPLDLGTIPLQAHRSPVVGNPLPALEGKTLDGENASLAALKGKVVLLDFWASWCAPCKAEIPHVKELAAKYAGDKGVVVLGVNLDYTVADGVRCAAAEKIPWHSLTFPNWGENNPVLQAFGVSSIPSVWLIDADGKLIARDIPPAELDTALEKALR